MKEEQLTNFYDILMELEVGLLKL